MENVRRHGNAPYRVVVVHGGPGAAGEMAPVATELASITGVLEPFQTATSVDGQIEELASVVEHMGIRLSCSSATLGAPSSPP